METTRNVQASFDDNNKKEQQENEIQIRKRRPRRCLMLLAILM